MANLQTESHHAQVAAPADATGNESCCKGDVGAARKNSSLKYAEDVPLEDVSTASDSQHNSDKDQSWLVAICTDKRFEAFIIILVFCNAITMAMDSPGASQGLLDVLSILELVFLAFFSAEALLKVMAFRLRYFMDPWNVMDILIVALGWITTFSLSLNLSALRVFRAFRALRILKGIGKVGGLKTLVESLILSIPKLGHVFSLWAFFMLIFSIVGVQLFQGVPSRRCYTPINEVHWRLDTSQLQRCSPAADLPWLIGGRSCDAGTTCWEPQTFPRNGCPPSESSCVYHEPVYSWDNILHSILMTIKITALDNWVLEQHKVQEGWAHLACLYFIGLLCLVTFFALNLTLAVLSRGFLQATAKERAVRFKRKVAAAKAHVAEKNERRRISLAAQACVTEVSLRTKMKDWLTSWTFYSVVAIVSVINVVILACDYFMAPEPLRDAITIVNVLCSVFFILEAAIKILVFGHRSYFFGEGVEFIRRESHFSKGGNRFHFFLVVMSILELTITGFGAEVVYISVFRCLRTTRLLQLARKFPRLKKQTSALAQASIESLYLVILLVVFICIFTILGMQLFGDKIDVSVPLRFSFRSLWQSAYTVFVILTGENWTEMMSITIQETSWAAALYYLLVFVTGRYILLNLFICILVDSLKDYSRKLMIINTLSPMARKRNVIVPAVVTGEQAMPKSPKSQKSAERLMVETGVSNPTGEKNAQVRAAFGHRNGQWSSPEPASPTSPTYTVRTSSVASLPAYSPALLERRSSAWKHFMNAAAYEDHPDKLKFLEDILEGGNTAQIHGPSEGLKIAPGFRGWCQKVVQNRYFTTTILLLILANSLFLAVDTPWTQNNCFQEPCDTHSMILYITDVFFTFVFLMEMLLKLYAYGPQVYLTSRSNLTDVFIVIMSGLGLFIPILKVCRVLRTLRLVSRVPSLKIAVNALFRALPALGTVHIILALIWLLFGILGVQLLMGRFWYCKTVNKEVLLLNQDQCLPPNVWTRNRWDFDNIGVAFVSLTIIAWGEEWDTYLWNAIDSTPPGLAPESNSSAAFGLFFVAFFIFGSFLSLNLFAAILIDEYLSNQEGLIMLTEGQKRYVRNVQVMIVARLPPLCARPSMPWRRKVLRFTASRLFTNLINVVILLNMLAMMLDYYQQPATWTDTLAVTNVIFVAIFACEAALKIVGYGLHGYLTDSWNRFDLFLVVVSIVMLPFDGPGASVFRVLRVLRMINRIEGMRICALALFLALPGLINILAFMAIVFFMFAVAGVQIFGRIDFSHPVYRDMYPFGLGETLNFSDLYHAFVLLFSISTIEGWHQMMESCILKPAGCEVHRSCGTSAAVPFFLMFMVTSSCILLNAIVVTVLANFEMAADQNQIVLAEFKVRWAFLDQEHTKVLPASRLLVLLRMISVPAGPLDFTGKLVKAGHVGTSSHLLMQVAGFGNAGLLQMLPIADALYIPIQRNLTVQYEQVVLAICRLIEGLSRQEVTGLAKHIGVHPPTDDCFCVHHLLLVRLLTSLWVSYRDRKEARSTACLARSPPALIPTIPESDSETCVQELSPDLLRMQKAHLVVDTGQTSCPASPITGQSAYTSPLHSDDEKTEVGSV
mmetsp:Transcript_62096/g.110645  ORF Transcript_62096/g.110645 Transcript_62096/m.110645 type:complete len:1592 (-) Transcript_62096:106-4881(-)